MGSSSFVQTAFLGGEISQTAQGRMDLPIYKLSMNVCLNGIPIESGAWMRRPGTRHVVPTRGGARGRLIAFPFAQSFPYMMEFTDGFLRFTTGPALVMTNDQQTIAAISTANPAVVQTATAHGWTTGNSVAFNSLGANNPLLQNRQFKITVVDTTHFSIADAITGAAINGSTLGTFVSGTVTRILEIATTYTAGSWQAVRSVQAEARTLLLNGTKPQVLQVATEPTPTRFATFSYGAADFVDGPYLDPIAGTILSPSGGQLNGVVTFTLSFTTYDSTRAYNIGDLVSFNGLNYQGLTALNHGNQPDTHPSNWKSVSAGVAVNDGTGFVASDIGRLVRLFSEPQLWQANTTYSTNQTVAYTDGNGGFNYWTASASIAANVAPGTSTSWALNATAAQWTWAQITSVTGSGLISAASGLGSLTGGGGLNAALDGNTDKAFGSSANFTSNVTTYPQWSPASYSPNTPVQYGGIAYVARMQIYPVYGSAPQWDSRVTYTTGQLAIYQNFLYQANTVTPPGIPPGGNPSWNLVAAISTSAPNVTPGLWASNVPMVSPTFDMYVGQVAATASALQSATLYPSNDNGFTNTPTAALTINLRGKTTAPVNAADGVLLATTNISNTTAPVTMISSDQATAYKYTWFEIVVTYPQPLPDDGSHNFVVKIGVAQAQFFSQNISNGAIFQAQIRGAALLYNQPIKSWRLGVYSDTTGWPTCGTYHEGRIWLGGVVSNRFDGGVSNGFTDVQLDFTPTAASGQVVESNAISYICDGEDVNQLLWMKPDQQGILFGTQAGEWLISAPSPGALAATNIKAVRVTKIGCANIEPRRAEHTLLFVQRFSRKVMEYFADVFSGKFSAPNLAERAKHLTVSGIAEIAYQQELAPIFWSRRNDGLLVGATYKRDTLTTSQGPNIIGWHRHQLGSGRLVESIAVGPSQNGNLDTLSMITNDPNTGIRHIELMTDLLDEGFALTDCWFLDDGIAPSSTAIQATTQQNPYGSLLVNGLSAHNGKTVTAFIAGLDCGDYVVSGGTITVPFGDGVSASLPNGQGSGLFTEALAQSFTTLPAVIGFTYNSDGHLVRPVAQADTGAATGLGFAKIGRQHRASMLLYGAVNGSIAIGTDFVTLDPIKLRYPNDVPYPVNVQWSGIWRDTVNSLLDYEGKIAWRIGRPLPGFIMAVGGFDSKADI